MSALYLGLMSGTSMDGVDAALCAFDGVRFAGVQATATQVYDPALRRALLRLQRELPAITLEELARLERGVTDTFAKAAQQALAQARAKASEVHAAGAHGQTVYHDPAGTGSSLQLLNPSLLAAQVGVTTVADFRRADIARGGQGAPLVPAFHHSVFAAAEPRCVLNVGGIANITILPDAEARSVRGFDTGPGNGLMDEWIQAQRGEPFDRDGAWAAGGRIHEDLLDALLGEPYFAQPPPKSTGRDRFNLEWARRRYAKFGQVHGADVQRTFCELTARSVAAALAQHGHGAKRLYVCGGGARNRTLMDALRAALKDVSLEDTGALGLDPGSVEPVAFAWLAMRALDGKPGNLPAVTGAAKAAVLGGIYRA